MGLRTWRESNKSYSIRRCLLSFANEHALLLDKIVWIQSFFAVQSLPMALSPPGLFLPTYHESYGPGTTRRTYPPFGYYFREGLSDFNRTPRLLFSNYYIIVRNRLELHRYFKREMDMIQYSWTESFSSWNWIFKGGKREGGVTFANSVWRNGISGIEQTRLTQSFSKTQHNDGS